MGDKGLSQNLFELVASILAAVVVVKGIIATTPDAILLDQYGEIHGIIQLALGVVAVFTFSAVYKWIDGRNGRS